MIGLLPIRRRPLRTGRMRPARPAEAVTIKGDRPSQIVDADGDDVDAWVHGLDTVCPVTPLRYATVRLPLPELHDRHISAALLS